MDLDSAFDSAELMKNIHCKMTDIRFHLVDGLVIRDWPHGMSHLRERYEYGHRSSSFVTIPSITFEVDTLHRIIELHTIFR